MIWRNVLHMNAIRDQHELVVLRALSGVMQAAGLWDGCKDTHHAAGLEHGSRFSLAEHRTAEPVTVVHFDGKRMCAIVTSIEVVRGALLTSTRAVP